MTELTYREFTRQLNQPHRSANATIDERRGFVVRLGGGIGEAAPLPPWTEPFDQTRLLLEHASDELEAGASPSSALSMCGGSPAARHAIAQAMLDHHARIHDKPLYRHLRPTPMVTEVRVNATLGTRSRDRLIEEADHARKEGFRTLKLKVGAGSVEDDIARVSSVREHVGEDIDIRVDANASWSVDTAMTFCEGVRQLRLDYLEQPVAGCDMETLSRLVETGVPIALDESLAEGDVVEALGAPVAAFVIKPMAVGGIDRAFAIARAARQRGKQAVISDLLSGAIGRAGAVHLAGAINPTTAHGLATGSRFTDDLVEDVVAVSDGSVPIPDGKGIGIDPEAIGI